MDTLLMLLVNLIPPKLFRISQQVQRYGTVNGIPQVDLYSKGSSLMIQPSNYARRKLDFLALAERPGMANDTRGHMYVRRGGKAVRQCMSSRFSARIAQ